MGFFRFRRSIRLLPGVRANPGTGGVSTSLGVRGAQVTLGHRQVRATVGLPGTGVSHTDVRKPAAPHRVPATQVPQARGTGSGCCACRAQPVRWYGSSRDSATPCSEDRAVNRTPRGTPMRARRKD